MSFEIFTAFLIFAVVGSITPGPNNIMLLTSGVHFGFKRSIPHIAGVVVGFFIMTLLVGLGFDAVFKAFPFLYNALKAASFAYLLYLAWKIARSGPIEIHDDTGKRPMRFVTAMGFQCINPKAWILAVSAISMYAPGAHYFANVLIISVVYFLTGVPIASLWTSFGTMFRHLLADARIAKIFNIVMALLLVLSMVPVIKELFNF